MNEIVEGLHKILWNPDGHMWSKTCPCDGCRKNNEISEIATRLGSLGGKARSRSLSKKEKSEHAKKMVRAREAKRRTKSIPPINSTK